jgi:serine/threonine-protein kinase
VHRDLKPENVLLEALPGDSFRAKIVDFGIARVSAPAEPDTDGSVLDTNGLMAFLADSSPEVAAPITHTGFVLGTPLYMAPELADGIRGAAPTCDLWSLGVLAYEVACGGVPFAKPPVFESGVGRIWKAPAIDLDRIAEPLRSVIRRCLDVDPSRRPSARDVAASLA